MKIKWVIVLCFLVAAIIGHAQSELPLPTGAQLQWQNAELVAVFHYDLHVFDGKKYNQGKNRITPI